MSHRLAELNDQRELMLGGISHDLRTPLARLRVAVELLGEGDRALTEEMTANIEEMDRMIGQFLHYIRASYREIPASASLDDIVRGALGVYATEDRVRLELGAPDRRWFALDSVRHAVMNLVQNALEYGRPPVTVRTWASSAEIRIEVHDLGAGLSEVEWAEAVRPFRRLTDQPAGAHTGLGLAMVERLVHVCGGSLEAKRVEGLFGHRAATGTRRVMPRPSRTTAKDWAAACGTQLVRRVRSAQQFTQNHERAKSHFPIADRTLPPSGT